MTTTHVRIAIVGSGFGGLGAAIRLKQHGIEDFVVLERRHDVGGVWRDNSYPGCACDVQSHLYSFSFAANPEWTRLYSPHHEIWAYLKRCAETFGIRPHLRFGHELLHAEWDDRRKVWDLRTTCGDFRAEVLVGAAGALSEPARPRIPGLASFQGTAFHSAEWDHGYDLRGKTVAVIGTGASAVQLVPEIQPKVGRLLVFQRTAPWILPRGDRAMSPRAQRWLRASPLVQKAFRLGLYARREALLFAFLDRRVAAYAERLARRHLERSVSDPALRARLTPHYTLGCKRVLLSDDYFPSLQKENVALITAAIREVRPRSIATHEEEHAVDAIVFSTGFRVQEPPIASRVLGREGKTLSASWADRMTAHLGTTVVGFPNFFLLMGPNTGTGHTSVLTILESQIEHMLKALEHLRAHDLATIEPTTQAQARFVAHVDARMQSTVWTTGGCRSWYLDSMGHNSALWPGFSFSLKRRLERFDPSDYAFGRAA